MKPDYAAIAEMEKEIYGEVFTVAPDSFKHRCVHCKAINRRKEGMTHSHGCPYRSVQTQ